MYSPDDTDKKILNRIQSDFPICEQPYAAIAEDLGLSHSTVIARIQKMKDNHIIRRIGGNFSPNKIGFESTLCAAKVPKEKINSFTKTVNSFSGVTHNYIREHEYNIWFTFIAESVQKIDQSLAQITQLTGVSHILNLPATHLFKISAKFKI